MPAVISISADKSYLVNMNEYACGVSSASPAVSISAQDAAGT